MDSRKQLSNFRLRLMAGVPSSLTGVGGGSADAEGARATIHRMI